MSVYERARFVDGAIVINKDKADDLLAALIDGGVDARAEQFEIRSDEIEVETFVIPDEQMEKARDIVRQFNKSQ